MIFSRGRGSGRHAKGGDEPARPGRHTEGRDGDADATESEAAEVEERAGGPYDIADAPAGVERIDLGSLQIPAVDGVEVRIQAAEDGSIQQVVLVHGDSALQLGVFAAPRTGKIWKEVRAEIFESLTADGGSATEVKGDFGVELHARVRTPEGPTELRFVGVDGPRWMVRGVYQGRAAVEPEAAALLDQCLIGLVVDRGKEAMPARDPLPLRLPRDIADQAAARQADGTPDGAPTPPTKAAPTKAAPAKATPGKATPTRATPTKAGPAKATPSKNTQARRRKA